MKKARSVSPGVDLDEVLPEYDFSRAKPNPYASRYRKGALVITLDPEVAEVFPTASDANEALRSLAKAVRSQRRRLAKRGRGAHNSGSHPLGGAKRHR
jgi:hypothetical protein